MTEIDWHEKLETNVERTFGTGDMRMLYGVGVPFVVMTGLIIAALVLESIWLTAVLMVLIVAFTAVVLIGLSHMLDDEDDSRVPH